MLASGDRITIEGTEYETLCRMIDFAYNGYAEWTPLGLKSDLHAIADRVDDLLDLLRGSDRWFMAKLHADTEAHFMQYFSIYVRPDNVDAVMMEAARVRAQGLVETCQAYSKANTKFVEIFRAESTEIHG